MSGLKPITAAEFEEWLKGVMTGDPKEARSFCERTMSPNYVRYQAGSGRTNFEQAVEKVTKFRTVCRKWVAPVDFIVVEGEKIAVRLTMQMIIGNGPEIKSELMFMATRDAQGRFEKVWELTMPCIETV